MKNKPLWDKNRFTAWAKEKRFWLENLTLRKAVKMEEGFLSSSLIWELRKNFFSDNPACLKDSLKKKK